MRDYYEVKQKHRLFRTSVIGFAGIALSSSTAEISQFVRKLALQIHAVMQDSSHFNTTVASNSIQEKVPRTLDSPRFDRDSASAVC